MAEAIDLESAERLLREAEFEESRLLWSSSNYVYLATLCADGGQQLAAIYKPEAGETPLWDFPMGTLYRREVAAYELAKLLGWFFVPPTVVREGPQGVGSVQLFVHHDRRAHYFEQRDIPGLVPQLQRIAVFDFVANNADRKGGHFLLDTAGRIWGIDHGLCFHTDYKMRTVAWDWAEEPIPDEWLDDVARVADLLERHDDLTAPFRSLLSAREVDGTIERARRLLRTRVFPSPGPHRSYPWPLV
ncbi:MAG: SCO1664 family protein [Dehalococcoidia bacterium]